MPAFRVSDKTKTLPVVKRAFFRAWQSCGGPLGMGIFQDRGPGMTEDQVWKNVETRGDYAGALLDKPSKNNAYGDYVFGRMMKLNVNFIEADGVIEIMKESPRIDYQGWAGTFPTYKSLFDAAAKELGVTLSIVVPSPVE